MQLTNNNSSASWTSLPNEIRLAIVDAVEPTDVNALAKVDQQTYQICVPAKFRSVKLTSFGALERFLENVPRGYYVHIENLELCTSDVDGVKSITNMPLSARTETVISLLTACSRLSKLTLRMAGSLDKSIVAPFPYLHNLKDLTIANCGMEEDSPLSERLVISIAANIRNLEILSLDRISRSKMHAPELEGNPYIPLVIGDADIPDHPVLGSELCLPSLLRIPTLRKLTIRDTHLGDERWTTTPIACRLEVVDLGSCYHEDEDFNSMCTERIMGAVGPTVDEFSLTTSVSNASFAKSTATPMQRLRKLHITPFFPVDSVVDTMSNLAGSPIEKISLQCYEDDVVDVCAALEEFLTLRVERGPEFYDKLQRIDVSVTALDDSSPNSPEMQERIEAARRLQDICREMRLASAVNKFSAFAASTGRSAVTSFTDAKRVKGRSMSI